MQHEQISPHFYYLKTTDKRIKGLTLASATFFGNQIDLENQIRDAVYCLVIDLFEVSNFIRNIDFNEKPLHH